MIITIYTFLHTLQGIARSVSTVSRILFIAILIATLGYLGGGNGLGSTKIDDLVYYQPDRIYTNGSILIHLYSMARFPDNHPAKYYADGSSNYLLSASYIYKDEIWSSLDIGFFDRVELVNDNWIYYDPHFDKTSNTIVVRYLNDQLNVPAIIVDMAPLFDAIGLDAAMRRKDTWSGKIISLQMPTQDQQTGVMSLAMHSEKRGWEGHVITFSVDEINGFVVTSRYEFPNREQYRVYLVNDYVVLIGFEIGHINEVMCEVYERLQDDLSLIFASTPVSRIELNNGRIDPVTGMAGGEVAGMDGSHLFELVYATMTINVYGIPDGELICTYDLTREIIPGELPWQGYIRK